ncbi:MAG: DUF1573 domain-containing protein [Bernardetiaceae bacterium]|nr:DUF1573 domain-containing protein [Bernardetiaceae bacterium]
MTKKITLSLLFCLMAVYSFAQGKFEFKSEVHDFGVVEEGEKATHEFEFKNVGNAPIILSSVRASCGCTTPEWTRDPVMPGETGKIKAIYNSQGRPGAFNKTITITSNAATPSHRISIKGNVVRDPSKDPNPVLVRSEAHLGKVKLNAPTAHKITVKNTGKAELMITAARAACNCVKLSGGVVRIAPNESAEVELLYTPMKAGEQVEEVSLYTNSFTERTLKYKLKSEGVDSLENKSDVRKTTKDGF